jgi:peptidoglycan/xylan/chitin deacetylase (PgdA/CDA1 family)
MIRVPVLMYHSVTDRPNAVTRPHAVRPADLDEQLSYLADNGFTPLTFGALATSLRRDGGRSLPARPVVLTFDDGYRDFHTAALPLLDKHDCSATVFLTSGWVADAGAEAAGRPPAAMLSWGQAREAAQAGVEFGGHSHSHPQLDQLPVRALREELRRSKGLLEDGLGVPVATLAYPFGYSSSRVRREACAAGYSAACTVTNRVGGRDLFALPRLTVGRRTGIGDFARAVEGRAVPLLYLRERTLTAGYAVVRRARRGLRRLGGHG